MQLIYYISIIPHTTPKRAAYGHTPHKSQERPSARINNTIKNYNFTNLQLMKALGGNLRKKFHKECKSVCNARSSFRNTRISIAHNFDQKLCAHDALSHTSILHRTDIRQDISHESTHDTSNLAALSIIGRNHGHLFKNGLLQYQLLPIIYQDSWMNEITQRRLRSIIVNSIFVNSVSLCLQKYNTTKENYYESVTSNYIGIYLCLY
jgi:hypothetical protein